MGRQRGDGPKLPHFMGKAQRGPQLNPNAAATIALQQHKPSVTCKPLALVWTGKTTVVCVPKADGSIVRRSMVLMTSNFLHLVLPPPKPPRPVVPLVPSLPVGVLASVRIVLRVLNLWLLHYICEGKS